jgi:cytochrome c biogenesis protein CcmG, thiol:disulfide interchange protein DsbE
VIRTPPAALLLLACACASPAPRPAARASPLVGQPLDVAAQDPAGKEVRVEAGQGRVVVIDFFATWCVPCRAQLPHLAQLSRDLGDRGLAVFAVSFDESPAALQAYAAGPAAGLPLLWDRGGERLSPALAISRLPTTVVADRRGVIRSVHVGWDQAAGRRLEAEVRALLDEPVTSAAAR